MNDHAIEQYKHLISTYIFAKDENRPWYMPKVFSNDALLEMAVETSNIDFPSQVKGEQAITDVLVRNFGRTYENVFTFCLQDTITDGDNALSCDWVVFMTDKESGELRVGWGRYHWAFESPRGELMASALKIQIQQMDVLSPEAADAVFPKVTELSYPWTNTSAMHGRLKEVPVVKNLSRFLNAQFRSQSLVDGYTQAMASSHCALLIG